jgi:hypothetical protein
MTLEPVDDSDTNIYPYPQTEPSRYPHTRHLHVTPEGVVVEVVRPDFKAGGVLPSALPTGGAWWEAVHDAYYPEFED